MNFYCKLYFNIYNFYNKFKSEGDPGFKAVYLLSVSELLYLFNIICLVDLLGLKIKMGNLYVYGIGISVPVLNCFLFVYKDRYLDLEEYFFDNVSEKQNGWLSLFLILLPLIILPVLIYLQMKARGVI
jgi:hypothetical protein